VSSAFYQINDDDEDTGLLCRQRPILQFVV